jgi:hypothetical protein
MTPERAYDLTLRATGDEDQADQARATVMEEEVRQATRGKTHG